MIGGICIPFDKGEDGHSDGDVLLHAVTDAVLGAAAAGDIGSLFPPSDPQWKDADSKKLLLRAWELVRSRGWQLCNLDCVLALEQPRFNPYREAVCTSIASVLSVPSDCVFVKAKTGEKTGAIGHGEAVAAWVSCLLQKN
jgi:2-C-methyl-D-erythritol 4-phosphate cytidylyltransferase/2-C-methyl-D-erythritol 2,4-cyclodiphosphate synthase